MKRFFLPYYSAAQPGCFQSEILETLDQDTSFGFQPEDWFLGTMIILAGQTRCEAAAPLLLKHFEADWDWWNGEIAKALGKIGGPQVLKEICQVFPSAVEHARLFITGALKSFNFESAGSEITLLLHHEREDNLRVYLAEALAAQFEPQAALEACRVYKENPRDPEREVIASLLYAHSQIQDPGFEQTDINEWRQRLEVSHRELLRFNERNTEALKFLSRNNGSGITPGNSSLPVPESQRRDILKLGRNDPCPCGSGKKYKKCCLEKND